MIHVHRGSVWATLRTVFTIMHLYIWLYTLVSALEASLFLRRCAI